ncbi:helix-turn-helix transcriptional regulator [Cryptosporangium sp. NPDC048952]|uniref:helix-turn-helix transcriptional regulator n=1 Tax=Cryptosporangium sp. NPDC048952 TaxID=3363961 RepID=UPI00371C0612
MSEVAAVLKISPDTLYRWRQLGSAPRAIRLPNGHLRIRRSDLTAWEHAHLDDHEQERRL